MRAKSTTDHTSVPNTGGWEDRPLAELVQYIVEAYHEPLRRRFTRLGELAQTIVEEDNRGDVVVPSTLLETFWLLRDELTQHMLKEERVIFRMVLSEATLIPRVPIKVLECEHDLSWLLLEQLRELTDGYNVGKNESAALRDFYSLLGGMAKTFKEHSRLENDILFPALLARSMPAR